jgi:hypothetical protein
VMLIALPFLKEVYIEQYGNAAAERWTCMKSPLIGWSWAGGMVDQLVVL